MAEKLSVLTTFLLNKAFLKLVQDITAPAIASLLKFFDTEVVYT